MTTSVGPKIRRTRQPAATYERLIKATFEVLKERGFEAATTDEVVRRAGLSNGALYNLFSSKGELLATALEYETASVLEMVAALEARPGDTIEKLLQIVRAWDRLSPLGGSVIADVLARARRDEAVRAIYLRLAEAIEATFTREIRRGQQSGHVRRDLQPEAIARLLSAIGAGYQAETAAGLPEINSGAWVGILAHVIESLRPLRRSQKQD